MPLDSVWDRFPPVPGPSSLVPRPLPDSFIQRLIAKVSQDSIRARLQRLQDFSTRYSPTDSCRRAEEYVASYFTSLGLDSVELDPYTYGADTWRNVVGTILGRTHPEKILIVCGHMDATSEIPDSVAPGCEDNGSGTCAAIEAARVLVGESLDYTVKFIAFTGEDIGLNGSDHYATEARARGDDIICAFNFDMIAWPGGSWGVRLVGLPAARRFVQFEAQMANTYTALGHSEQYRSFPSDSRSFETQGYMATSGYEFGNDPYVYYHTSQDSLYRLSMPLAAEVTQMAVATVASLAVAPLAPTGFELQDAGNGTSLEASWQSNSEPDLAGYKLLWGTAAGIFTDSVSLGLVTSHRIDGLQTDTCYYAVVVARDSDGFEGGPSNEASATPRLLPLAPDSLLAMPFRFGMRLSWLPNHELDLAGYNLYRGSDSVGLVRINPSIITDTAYRDSGLMSDTMYWYAVTAVDTQDNESQQSTLARGKPITLDHGILLVDETRNGNGQPGSPSDAQVDDFYHAMLRGFSYTDWDATDLGVPLAGDVGPYSTIVWHGDDYSQQQLSPALAGIANYLTYGGKLWLVGWKPVLAVAGSGQYPFAFVPGQFAFDYLHITAGFDQQWFDFPGATGFSGYPDVSVDSAKIFASAHGRLPYVDAFAVRDGDTVLRFNSFSSDTFFQGKPVGIRWLGAQGKVVFFGFPFYYMKDVEARPVAIKVLTDLGEPYGIEESDKSQVEMTKALPTIVRKVLFLPEASSHKPQAASLLDACGREVMDLRPGANDVRSLAPGVYFIHMAQAQAQAQAIRKVVVTQ
jgi:aminopeptidase YwaD